MTQAIVTIQVGPVSRIVAQSCGPLTPGQCLDLANDLTLELAALVPEVVGSAASTAEADHGAQGDKAV